MMIFLLEAALRSMLMALAIWGCIGLLRVRAVLAQKVAWVLVLLAAGAMPFVMRASWLTLDGALLVPVRSLPWMQETKTVSPKPAGPTSAGQSSRVEQVQLRHAQIEHAQIEHAQIEHAQIEHAQIERFSMASKPTAAHRSTWNKLPMELAETLSEEPETALSTVAAAASATLSAEAKGLVAAQPVSKWQRVWTGAVVAYFVVLSILLLRMSIGLAIAFRVWHRARTVSNLPVSSSSIAKVRVSREIATPVTIGSTVILPADYAEWDEEKLRVVLAHERSHVSQRDFYLQVAAALHVAVFWFSPLGWWLQRKLSELGEALSDRAGLEEAADASSYAQILLEFAAMPRNTLHALPLTGVAMARSSNLAGRIERILNDRRFRLEVLGGRRHAFLTALLVPAALVGVVACIRIVPGVESRVEAAETPAAASQQSGQVAGRVSGRVSGQVSGPVSGQVSGVNFSPASDSRISTILFSPARVAFSGVLSAVNFAQEVSAPPTVAPAPVAPNPPQQTPAAPPAPEVEAPAAPEPPEVVEDEASGSSRAFAYGSSRGDDDSGSFAIIRGKDSSSVIMSGHAGKDLAKAKEKYHGDFIWFERNGKSYVITDPAILARSEGMFAMDPRLKQMQESLEAQQRVLNKRMAEMNTQAALAQLETPEYKASMARLEKQLAELQGDRMKKLTEEMSQKAKEFEKLSKDAALASESDRMEKLGKLQEFHADQMEKLGELQGQIGEIQGQIGELQGQLGERRGEWGEKQGELGEKMGELGEQMGKIGEEQGRKAEEASRKMKSVLDQAVKDRKAVPVE